jgi:hypothetical protein
VYERDGQHLRLDLLMSGMPAAARDTARGGSGRAGKGSTGKGRAAAPQPASPATLARWAGLQAEQVVTEVAVYMAAAMVRTMLGLERAGVHTHFVG